MSAVASETVLDQSPLVAPTGPRLSPELEEVILEIAASERALDDFLNRSDRLHDSNIQHDPSSCLVCFSAR
ncbi:MULTISPECIES: hypothetical protein [unclassified Nocardioides]|uniref:hypothetical protein n=1 Tax=unclassified Nocardioides TaxID=2615069 RepID=UPI000ABE9802|nr:MULTISPECIES: hypothetical protein [unclassified Nocardioides]